MALTIQRAGDRLRIGRRSFKLYPEDPRELAVCEDAFDKISFAPIRQVPAAEFPVKVELIVNPVDDDYEHATWLSIARLPRRMRIEIIARYHYCDWAGPGTLREHVNGMVRSLRKTRRLKVALDV